MQKANSGRLISGCGKSLAAGLCLLLPILFFLRIASAQEDEIAPNGNLEIIGIPRVPASLAQQVKRYSGVYGLPLAGWHPNKRELWVKGISSASWVSRIESPGGAQKMWLYLQAAGIYEFYFRPQADYLVYNRDEKGDEAFQFYLYGVNDRKSAPLSDGKSRNTEPVWSNSGGMIVYSSSPPKGNGVSLSVINPFDAKSNRLLVESTGNYLKAYDWSPDNKQVVYCEFISNAVSRLWVIDIASGEKRLLSTGDKTYFSSPQFGKDGKGLYVITDQDSDFRRLAYFDLKTKRFKYLSSDIKWDVDEFQLSPDGKRLVFVTNEDGVSRLRLIDLTTGAAKPIENPQIGIISDLKWRSDSIDLAFNFRSPRTPNAVYSINTDTGKIDWIKTQPYLDADRVMVQGSSYGGYMALSVAARYSDRIKGAISDSGPSNLATFVERTEGWRRDVRRAEFGDERDPKVRAFMEKSAPLNNAQKIKKPLFVIQGRNDPRVPASEAEAIVQAVKKNEVPVWLLMAKDEGHDFVVPHNRNFRLYSTILFVKEYLLK